MSSLLAWRKGPIRLWGRQDAHHIKALIAVRRKPWRLYFVFLIHFVSLVRDAERLIITFVSLCCSDQTVRSISQSPRHWNSAYSSCCNSRCRPQELLCMYICQDSWDGPGGIRLVTMDVWCLITHIRIFRCFVSFRSTPSLRNKTKILIPWGILMLNCWRSLTRDDNLQIRVCFIHEMGMDFWKHEKKAAVWCTE